MSQARWEAIKEYEQEIIAGDAIAIIWTIEDVEEMVDKETITKDQKRETLRRLYDKHDAEHGINWETISWVAYEVLEEGP